jgi:hypothetical protein
MVSKFRDALARWNFFQNAGDRPHIKRWISRDVEQDWKTIEESAARMMTS